MIVFVSSLLRCSLCDSSKTNICIFQMFHSASIAELNEQLQFRVLSDKLDHDHGHMKISITCPSYTRGVQGILNAIRRTIIGSVPTMRIDDVWCDASTTSADLDEIYFKMGQIPITIDPRLFHSESFDDDRQCFRPDFQLTAGVGHGIGYRPTKHPVGTLLPECPPNVASQQLLFTMDVTCYFDEVKKCMVNENVTSGHLQWIRLPGQEHIPAPTWPQNLVIRQGLKEGERIRCEQIIALKGCGSEHTKWRGANAHVIELERGNDQHFIFTITSLDGNPVVDYYWKEALKLLQQKFVRIAEGTCAG